MTCDVGDIVGRIYLDKEDDDNFVWENLLCLHGSGSSVQMRLESEFSEQYPTLTLNGLHSFGTSITIYNNGSYIIKAIDLYDDDTINEINS